MVIAMRDVEKIDRKIMVADSFHHGHKALQGRARSAPVRPIRLPRSQYSGIWCFIMLLKALQRLVDNWGILQDEITIALGDVPWIYKKLHLVSGSTHNNNDFPGHVEPVLRAWGWVQAPC